MPCSALLVAFAAFSPEEPLRGCFKIVDVILSMVGGVGGVVVRDLEPGDFWQVVELYYGFYREVDGDPTKLGVEVGLALEEKPPSIADEFAWFAEKLRAWSAAAPCLKSLRSGEAGGNVRNREKQEKGI